ncbi:hypothetical protein K501DRAFT_277847 [Backusella circina FSU 941]|nr:hypothetical protein K501DRAFT_277847 [Backusella circina FSU 941]
MQIKHRIQVGGYKPISANKFTKEQLFQELEKDGLNIRSLLRLIEETEVIIGQEKERCTLVKDMDLTNLDQSKEAFQRDLFNMTNEIDMLEWESCFLKTQLQEKDEKINSMKKASQDAALFYVQEKKKIKDKYNQELAEKDKTIRFLQNTTENLMRLMENRKRERETREEVALLGFARCTPQSQDITNKMDNLSMLEGTQK